MWAVHFIHRASLGIRQKLHKLDQGVSLLFHFRHGHRGLKQLGYPQSQQDQSGRHTKTRNQVKGEQKQLHLSCHSHEILEPHLAAG